MFGLMAHIESKVSLISVDPTIEFNERSLERFIFGIGFLIKLFN